MFFERIIWCRATSFRKSGIGLPCCHPWWVTNFMQLSHRRFLLRRSLVSVVVSVGAGRPFAWSAGSVSRIGDSRYPLRWARSPHQHQQYQQQLLAALEHWQPIFQLLTARSRYHVNSVLSAGCIELDQRPTCRLREARLQDYFVTCPPPVHPSVQT